MEENWRPLRTGPHDLNRAECGSKNRLRNAAKEKTCQGALSMGADHDEIGSPLFRVLRDCLSGKTQVDFGRDLVTRSRRVCPLPPSQVLSQQTSRLQ